MRNEQGTRGQESKDWQVTREVSRPWELRAAVGVSPRPGPTGRGNMGSEMTQETPGRPNSPSGSRREFQKKKS